jgi:hypothetical protein
VQAWQQQVQVVWGTVASAVMVAALEEGVSEPAVVEVVQVVVVVAVRVRVAGGGYGYNHDGTHFNELRFNPNLGAHPPNYGPG